MSGGRHPRSFEQRKKLPRKLFTKLWLAVRAVKHLARVTRERMPVKGPGFFSIELTFADKKRGRFVIHKDIFVELHPNAKVRALAKKLLALPYGGW